ncbi:MAG: O-antigen ligase [Acidimicrobiales bacterium]|nr:O-antigen ligase [Acidimicrobiales bacterium]
MPFAGDVPAADLAICAYATGLLVVWSPGLNAGLLTPRTALAYMATGPGLVVLAGLARRGDRGARWAVAFLAVAFASAVLSGAARISLLGSYQQDRGWIYLAAALGAWALGRRLGPAGRRLLPVAVLAGVVVNVVMAFLEAITKPLTGPLVSVSGRVQGLAPESLFLGGYVAGALALTGLLVGGRGRRWYGWLVGIVAFTAVDNLTGSRGALAAGLVLALIAPVVAIGRGDRRRVAVRTGAVALAIVLGFLLSGPLANDASGAGRLGSGAGSGGLAARVTMWKAGAAAVVDRPVLGYGPGRFRVATSARTTAAFTRSEGPDRLYFDAHNVAVEQLVTTGVLGLVAVAGFAWCAARAARGPMAWFAVGVVATWLLEPVSISTGPLALLALGAASTIIIPAPRPRGGRGLRPAVVVGVLLAAVGLAAGSCLVAADALVHQGVEGVRVDRIRAAQRLLPPDAVLSDLEAQVYGSIARLGPAPGPRHAAIAASRRTVRLDPTRPLWWTNLGFAEGDLGFGPKRELLARSERAFREGLRLDPWSVAAMDGLRRIALAQGDAAEARSWARRMCEAGSCPPKG